jgi:hypothetical protein
MFDKDLMFTLPTPVVAGSTPALDLGLGGAPLSGIWVRVFEAGAGTSTAPGLAFAVEASNDATGTPDPWVQIALIPGVLPQTTSDAKINNYARVFTRKRYLRLTITGTGNLASAVAGVTHGAYYTPEQQSRTAGT